MPTVLRERGYRMFFYASDGREPRHVHIVRGDGHAKVWLHPVQLAWSNGFTRRDLRDILHLVRTHQAMLRVHWDDFFQG